MREEAVNDAASELDESSSAAGVAGLNYVRALDGTGNERTTEAAYTAAVAQFVEDLTDFVDATDDLSYGIVGVSYNQALFNYVSSICPVPTPTPSPSPSPSPSEGGLGDLLADLLGGLLGG